MDAEKHGGSFKIWEPFLAFISIIEFDDWTEQTLRGVQWNIHCGGFGALQQNTI